MADRATENKTEFVVACISDTARLLHLKHHEAYGYLIQFKGLEFLLKHYEILHTLPMEESINSMLMICKRNGGGLG